MTFISLDTNLGGGTIKGMKNTYANKPTKLQGFTIVELLIVIVVIAILAVISVAAYSNIQMKARNSARIAEAKEWVKILNMYAVSQGQYPFSSGSACLGYNFPIYSPNTVGSCWGANTGTVVFQNDTINKDIEQKLGITLPNYNRSIISRDVSGGSIDRIGPAGRWGSGVLYVYYWLESPGKGATDPCPAGSKTWSSTNGNAYACRIPLPTL